MTTLPEIFDALSDSTRFEIVERLLREGELSAGTISEVFPISAPAVSRHLDVLTRAGVLNRRVDRQRRMYSVVPESLKQVSTWTMDHHEFWETSLLRLEQALMQENDQK